MTTAEKRQELRDVAKYRSNMGGMATAGAVRRLGGVYGSDYLTTLIDQGSPGQVDDTHEYLIAYIRHMRQHPRTTCRLCGQIVPK